MVKVNIQVKSALNKVVNDNADGGLLCGCDACKALVAKVKGLDKNIDIFDNSLADVRKDGAYLVVEKPGIYHHKPLFGKTNEYSHLFFPKKGRFSYFSIYREIWKEQNSDKRRFSEGCVTNRAKRMLGRGHSKLYEEKAKKIFPFEVKNKTELERKTPKWRDAENSIIEIIRSGAAACFAKVEEVEEVEEGYFLIYDKYIPVIYHDNRYGRKIAILTSKDTAVSKLNNLKNLTGASVRPAASKILRSIENYQLHNYCLLGYDVKSKEIVYSNEISDTIHQMVLDSEDLRNSLKNLKMEKSLELMKNTAPLGKFINALNANLAAMGSKSWKAITGIPGVFNTSYHQYNYKRGENVVESKEEYGYSVTFEFDGKPYIGAKGRGGGYTNIRSNNDLTEFILIQSAWCQRVSSWSKNDLGVIDQHYNIWPIVDWLSGPYSEKENLKDKNLQLVFSGNKSRTSKRDIINKFRNNLRKKMAR